MVGPWGNWGYEAKTCTHPASNMNPRYTSLEVPSEGERGPVGEILGRKVQDREKPTVENVVELDQS